LLAIVRIPLAPVRLPEALRVRLARGAEYGLVAAAALAYAATLACHAASPALEDHVEPGVGAIASALASGAPPYHGLTGEASYELPYGPAVFAVHALTFAIFGRSVIVLKASGLAACGLAAWLSFVVFRRRASLRCASGGLLLLLLYLAYYDARAFWCRPEPFLLLGSAAGLWIVRTREKGSALGLALVVAWMVDLKATGPLYLLPILAIAVARRGWRKAASATLVGVALALGVFVIPPLSLGAYLELLLRTARHGLSVPELTLNVSAAALLIGPAIAVRAVRVRGPPRPPQRAPWLVPTGWLVASAAIVCVVAAKPGAGRHHLIPLLPVALDAFMDGVDGIERDRVSACASLTLTLVERVAACALVLALSLASVRAVRARAGRARRASAELESVLLEHRSDDVGMGYGGAASYDDASARLLVAIATPVRLDAASQMDSTAAGFPASVMLGRAIARCRPRVWILPSGDPFSMESFYGGAPVFDETFRREFARRYELVETRAIFRVYRCRDGSAPEPPDGPL
jgi:hypothetical protein